MKTWRTTKLVILAALLGLLLAPAASAQFAAHGSLDPVIASNGFPTSVTDSNGVSLDLPSPPDGPYGDGLTAPTMIYRSGHCGEYLV